MKITYKNCGNIKKADIQIVKDRLNIKYGMNGIGKTTLGKSLDAFVNNNIDVINRYVSFGSSEEPKVSFDGISSTLYFDNDYVERFLFREDLINNTFEIIVKTEDYEIQKSIIRASFEDLITEIKSEELYNVSEEINQVLNTVKLDKNKKNFLGSTSFAKGIKKINIETIIDDKISGYKKMLVSPNNFEWIDWFKKGKLFVQDNDCPFCLSKLDYNFDNMHNVVINAFDKTSLKNSGSANATLATIRKYTTKEISDNILSEQKTGTIGNESIEQIKTLLTQFELENVKLQQLQNLNFISLSYLSKDTLQSYFDSFKLTVSLYKNISEEVYNKTININNKLSEYIKKIEVLNTELIKLKVKLTTNIKKLHKFVNDFFEISGIPYHIETVINSEEDCKTILKPIDIDMMVDDPKNTLSYGERNAISLILFSVEAINKNVDLIILDDPVSSFDGSKKYAIIYQLFSSKVRPNLRGKTVLMLTHDFVPIIDFVYNGLPIRGEIEASYLYNKNGEINELAIDRNDIISCVKNEERLARDIQKNHIARLVHLRNYFDLINKNDSDEYSLISNLLHFRSKPLNLDETEMTSENILHAASLIKDFIEEFDYNNSLTIVDNVENIKELFNGSLSIDKVIAARLLLEKDPSKQTNKILWKYLCEFFHNQNLLLFDLATEKYELIPEYILKACSDIFATL